MGRSRIGNAMGIDVGLGEGIGWVQGSIVEEEAGLVESGDGIGLFGGVKDFIGGEGANGLIERGEIIGEGFILTVEGGDGDAAATLDIVDGRRSCLC